MESIYDKYADFLYRLAYMNMQNKADAEDVVHDVFIKYYEKSPNFHDEEHEKAWFVRVTINKCRDHLRKIKYRKYIPLEEIHNIEIEKDENVDVIKYLKDISERYRTVMVLHYLEGYSVNEISHMLRISASAVKMRLSRGRELLKNKIEKEENHV